VVQDLWAGEFLRRKIVFVPMSKRTLIWIGLFIGSAIGGYLPAPFSQSLHLNSFEEVCLDSIPREA
jgi:hypothetical protein